MVKIAYDLRDAGQAALGGFSAVFFFFLLRSGNPVNINSTVGFFLGIAWLTILYNPLARHPSEHKIHFAGNLAISLVIAWYMSVWFELVNPNVLWTFSYFGTTAWLTVLMAMPVALIFDRRNLSSILDRYYSRR